MVEFLTPVVEPVETTSLELLAPEVELLAPVVELLAPVVEPVETTSLEFLAPALEFLAPVVEPVETTSVAGRWVEDLDGMVVTALPRVPGTTYDDDDLTPDLARL